jgi:phosphoribosylglycinamide formyltransferase-1
MTIIRLGILGSTRGTDMLALIEAIQQKQLAASIEIVISNKEEAGILTQARKHGIPTHFLDPLTLSRTEYDEKTSAILNFYTVDLIILIGYMRILSADFIAQWPKKIINVHPSLLPAFAGGMDQDVHQAVLAAGIQETGCTVHYVTEKVDGGPILLQKKCPVFPTDTIESLKARVQKLEGEVLIDVIAQFIGPGRKS